jgi:glycerol-3-phosphate acyltransferase PlsY
LSGATFPLWLVFGEASLTAHLVLVVIGILTWLGSMGFGAAAFGRRFRIYSLVSLAVVVTFNAPEVAAGQPTPWIGLYERIAFSAYLLWLSVLAVALWRRRAIKQQDGDLEDRTQAAETV